MPSPVTVLLKGKRRVEVGYLKTENTRTNSNALNTISNITETKDGQIPSKSLE